MVQMEPQLDLGTVSRPTCLVCGAPGDLLYSDLRDFVYGAPGTWGFRRCQDAQCGLIWLDPAPRPENIHLAYENYFTHTDARGSRGRVKWRDRLYACYRSALKLLDRLLGLGHALARAEEMYLTDRPPGYLLDVGCGDGCFLHRMKQRGWQVAGVDFDPAAVAAAREHYGLEIVLGDLLNARFPSAAFDAVTLNHVVEHLYAPLETLREVRRILRPSGVLVLVTPNPNSLGHRRYGAHWFGLDPPRHLQLFPPVTLAKLVEQAGFRNVTLETLAVHADVFFGASRSIRAARDRGSAGSLERRIRVFRTVAAMAERYYEHFYLHHDPLVGEETLIYARPGSP